MKRTESNKVCVGLVSAKKSTCHCYLPRRAPQSRWIGLPGNAQDRRRQRRKLLREGYTLEPVYEF